MFADILTVFLTTDRVDIAQIYKLLVGNFEIYADSDL
jgi:hypothetical protein